jgi:hypothetical protein
MHEGDGRSGISPFLFRVSRGNLARAAAVAALLATLRCATASPRDPSVSSGGGDVELAAVIETVKQAIVEAQTRDVRGFPPLKRVVLKLQTSVSRSATGEVRYLVASVGATAGSETVSSLELTMIPADLGPRRGIGEAQLKDALAQAIHAAKLGVAEAAKGDPPMEMSGVSVDLKFAVSASGTAGVNAKIQLLPVGLGASGAISRERQHEVHLVFGASS